MYTDTRNFGLSGGLFNRGVTPESPRSDPGVRRDGGEIDFLLV